MKLLLIGFALSIGWNLGDAFIAFLYYICRESIKKARWYQEIIWRKETIKDHDCANVVKNKIGFNIN